MDLRYPRQLLRHGQRPGLCFGRQPAAESERSQNHHVEDRSRRDQPLQERRPSRQLARMCQNAQTTHCTHRGRTPLMLNLTAPSHCDESRPRSTMGSRARTVHQRRSSQQYAFKTATLALHNRSVMTRHPQTRRRLIDVKYQALLLLLAVSYSSAAQKIATLEVSFDRPPAGISVPVSVDLDAITHTTDS